MNKDSMKQTEELMKIFKLSDTRVNRDMCFSLRPALSNIPSKFFTNVDFNFNNIDNSVLAKNILNNIRGFCNDNGNLYIWSSESGTGKSTYSVMAMIKLAGLYAQYIDKKNKTKNDMSSNLAGICKLYFISLPEYLVLLQGGYSDRERLNEVEEKMIESKLLVLDDIATDKLTDAQKTRLQYILDAREGTAKGTIFTSNLSPEELESAVGKRLLSRILKQKSKILHFGENDMRISEDFHGQEIF